MTLPYDLDEKKIINLDANLIDDLLEVSHSSNLPPSKSKKASIRSKYNLDKVNYVKTLNDNESIVEINISDLNVIALNWDSNFYLHNGIDTTQITAMDNDSTLNHSIEFESNIQLSDMN